jgi:hypothetical protein
MRKITTAITAAALAFSMMAAAVPAAAVTGYDSAYAGESAFVNIVGGQTQNFQVFFANTGTTSWVKGTGTQVDLAACLEDKVTCNAQDASEATWNSGWLSAVRYATTTQTTTPPGSLGTFSYNITAPVGVAAGIYHFNGDVVLASTGEKIHPEGYFQDANTGVGVGAATITSLAPNTGTNAGGTTVAISGSGIICTPAFPTVAFGTANAVVTSCGATALTAKSPAGAVGTVTVTVTNPGAGPSNGLIFTYQDTTPPTFTSVAVAGSFVTVTFDEPVCRQAAWSGADWNINNISSGATDIPDAGDSIPLCNAAADNGVTSAVIDMTPATITPGAFVEVTLNVRTLTPATTATADMEAIRDKAGNPANAPQARQATATSPETVKPTLVSVSGAVGTTTITLTFSEPVRCAGGWAPAVPTSPVGKATLDDSNAATVDPTVTGWGATLCGATPTTATTSFSLALNKALPADTTYAVTLTGTAGDIKDVVGNNFTFPATVNFTTGAGDFTPPTIIDARMVNNVLTTDFAEAGDSFSLTFSEKMNGGGVTANATISIQDQDGTVANIWCGPGPAPTTTPTAGPATCSWNTGVTTLTVTLTGALPNSAGTTPGMQIPFNITALNGITDVAGNPPNILGSPDRLVRYK